MTAYLSKQHSCSVDLDGGGECGEGPCSFSWHHQHPHHRYHKRSVPGGATLSCSGGRMVNWHLDSSPSRSLSHLEVRAKGGGCDLAPHQCGCVQSWQEPYQREKRVQYSITVCVGWQFPLQSPCLHMDASEQCYPCHVML
ncbi:hypothetical protein KUCAC02_003281, partial [Chaenocephalus aceratus]